MNETANSNPVIAKNNENGTNVKIKIIIRPENILNKKVDKILSRVCPAQIFAKSLIPKLPALAP